MLSLALFTASLALAGSSAPDPTKVCASEQGVVMSPRIRSRFRGGSHCPSLVTAEAVANYQRAFAVYTRELSDPETAEQLARHVDARWVIVEDASGYLVFDAEAKGFVDPSLFAAGPPKEETPAEAAYRQGYQALRAKRYDDARTHLAQCLTLAPEHAGCHWESGWVAWVAEDWAAAAAAWSAVETHAPDHPELDVWLPQARAKAEPAGE
ncbi:MAG: hypothetical protein ACI8PZ_004724 [Myxococcota bacterium]|jgi:hypothetical protein